MQTLLILAVIVFIVLFLVALNKDCACIEGYRDPIYLNRSKLVYDWYPRANGSIYGFALPWGSWNLFSGFPYYPKAY